MDNLVTNKDLSENFHHKNTKIDLSEREVIVMDHILLYFANKLKYLSKEHTQAFQRSGVKFEQYVRQHKLLSANKWRHLRFLLVKNHLLQAAVFSRYINQTQAQQLLESNIQDVQKQILSSRSLAYIPLEFYQKVLQKLLDEGAISNHDIPLINDIFQNYKGAQVKDLQGTSQTMSSKTLSVLGPYKILEQIGVGGMGKVYKAFHPQVGSVVFTADGKTLIFHLMAKS